MLPIKEKKLLNLTNVAFTRRWGGKVRKIWKNMVMEGRIKDDVYREQKKCLICGEKFIYALDMFCHIKAHLDPNYKVKKNMNVMTV